MTASVLGQLTDWWKMTLGEFVSRVVFVLSLAFAIMMWVGFIYIIISVLAKTL